MLIDRKIVFHANAAKTPSVLVIQPNLPSLTATILTAIACSAGSATIRHQQAFINLVMRIPQHGVDANIDGIAAERQVPDPTRHQQTRKFCALKGTVSALVDDRFT
jgi:hypothetical protein